MTNEEIDRLTPAEAWRLFRLLPMALLDDDRDYLIVVGALHLVGPDGLPSMLSDRGLTVTRH